MLMLPLVLVSLGNAATAAPNPMCVDIQTTAECPIVDKLDPEKGGCTCEVVKTVSGTRELKEVVVLHVAGTPTEGLGSIDELHLAVRGADGAWKALGQIATSWEPGAFGIHNEGTLVSLSLMTTKDVGDVATIKVKQGMVDSDMGSNAVSSVDSETTIYCFEHDAKPACVDLWTSAAGGVEKLMDEDPAPPKEYGPLGIKEAKRSVSLNAKVEVVVGAVKGQRPLGFDNVKGTFTFAKLLEQKDLTVRR